MRTSIITLIFLFVVNTVTAQDSTFHSHIQSHTYQFDIVDGELVGEGAEFLKTAYEESHYVLFGEYHLSPRISEFTLASLKVLNDLDFKAGAFEVGNTSMKNILSEINHHPEKSASEVLKAYQSTYNYLDVDEEVCATFPFFENEYDAAFLQYLVDANWQIMGLDQEFYAAIIALLDIMSNRCNSTRSDQFVDMVNVAKNNITNLLRNEESNYNFFKAINSDTVLAEVIDQLQECPDNQQALEDLKASLNIYNKSYIDYQYYDAFISRLAHFKHQLRQQMQEHQFDLSKDKLFLKFGGLHTGKGTTTYQVLDIGNTLAELAQFYGHTSLHVLFQPRYYEEDGELFDDGVAGSSRFTEIVKYGSENLWTVIDLRAFRPKGLFYPNLYELSPTFEQLIINHDLLVIPKKDFEADLLFTGATTR